MNCATTIVLFVVFQFHIVIFDVIDDSDPLKTIIVITKKDLINSAKEQELREVVEKFREDVTDMLDVRFHCFVDARKSRDEAMKTFVKQFELFCSHVLQVSKIMYTVIVKCYDVTECKYLEGLEAVCLAFYTPANYTLQVEFENGQAAPRQTTDLLLSRQMH